jgi:WhiA N-terminal LAGLIDADG-like domain/WhiA LAGLIDADG-like domain
VSDRVSELMGDSFRSWAVGTRGKGTPHMAMTAMVKDELSRVECTKTSERKAEVTALLRFSGGLHIVGGRVVIEAELDTGSVARRLRRDISEVYGYTSGVSVLAGGNIRRGVRYLVRIAKHGEGLARQTGLVDQRGRPVRGLPPSVVSGGINDAEAAWRGAFLAHGSLTEPGRSSSLEVTCPGPEAAMALVGAARRLGIPAKAREVRGADRVVIRDGDAAGQLRRRQPAPIGPGRGRRQRPGGACPGDPGERRAGAPARRRPAAAGVRSGVAGGAGPAGRPADDQGRGRRADPPPAGHGRQAGEGPRHPGHRIRRHRRHAGAVALR